MRSSNVPQSCCLQKLTHLSVCSSKLSRPCTSSGSYLYVWLVWARWLKEYGVKLLLIICKITQKVRLGPQRATAGFGPTGGFATRRKRISRGFAGGRSRIHLIPHTTKGWHNV